MRLLAAGRDCDVFDLGDGTVLRRKRDGGSLEREAAVLRHARDHGLRCPAVHRAEGADLVLDLVRGPTQLEAVFADPTPANAHRTGRVLAEVHDQVHAVPPLDPASDGVLLHLDLHPANVLLAPDGPVVIDFVNATDGPPALDVADAWVVIGGVGGALEGVEELVAALLDGFLGALEREAARLADLPLVAAARTLDPHLSGAERAAIDRLVEREAVRGP